MVTSARRCAGCGGPLPDTPEEQRTITCSFCGIVNDLAHAAGRPQAQSITIDLTGVGKAAAETSRTVGRVVLGIVAIVALVVVAGIAIAIRPARDAIRDISQAATNVATSVRGIEPSALATMADVGWKEVQVSPPPTGWAVFAPVANLEWAQAVARAWKPDARLTRIDVTRATPAGVLDLTGDADAVAGYRFTSPSQIDEWERVADRDANARIGFEMLMQVAKGKMTVNIVRGRPSARPLPPDRIDTQPLGDVITRAIRSGKFQEYPFYSGYLIHLEREGWVWYLSSLSRRESLPRVRGRDGAVFPYR